MQTSEALQRLSQLSPQARIALQAEVKRRITDYEKVNLLDRIYPDVGPLRRELYPKHMEFFRATAVHQECALIAGNRTGKTTAVCYAGTLHLTGLYPLWWQGRRWSRPTVGWASGEDSKGVRESLQPTLIGPMEAVGTGLIPASRIIRAAPKSGVPDAVDFAEVRHISGGTSRLVFKAYEQGRESFQSAKIDFGILDEEPPLAIYSEILTRTIATVPGEANGLLMFSFTPLKGLSETVLQFLPGGRLPETEEERFKAWGWRADSVLMTS